MQCCGNGGDGHLAAVIVCHDCGRRCIKLQWNDRKQYTNEDEMMSP